MRDSDTETVESNVNNKQVFLNLLLICYEWL